MVFSEKISNRIKWLIWAYFWAIIFEGVLRIWIMPGLQRPLIFIKDPLVIWAYMLTLFSGLYFSNPYIFITIILGVISVFTSLLSNRTNPLVTLFGLRTNFLQLPFIFLIQSVFDIEDVERMGKWMMNMAFPMALFMVIQFFSPESSVFNLGTGGEGSSFMDAGGGHTRPSGFFTYNTGPGLFFPLTLAFLINSFFKKRLLYKQSFLLLAGSAVLIGAAVSGNRRMIVTMVIVFLFALMIVSVKPGFSGRFMRLTLIFTAMFLIFAQTTVFKEGGASLSYRFFGDDGDMLASEVQDEIIKRGINDLTVSWVNRLWTAPTFGYGVGTGTVIGRILSGESERKLIIEEEWGRIIYESGPFFGICYILFRIWLVLFIFLKSYRSLNIDSNALPLLIFGASASNILNGQFGQTTQLGFAVLSAGLCLAACNTASQKNSYSDIDIQRF